MILSPAPEKGVGDFYDGLFDAQGGIHRGGARNTKADVVNTKAVADHFQVSVSTAVERGVGLGLLKVW